MLFRRAVLLACLLIFSASAVFGGQAAMSRYDSQQTGYTSEKLQLPLALKWEFTTNKYDNNPAAPAVVDGMCYFASGDRIYAVDLATGTGKWRYPLTQNLGGAVKGAPAVLDGKIYFGAGDGNLYCVNAETGTFEWAYPTRGSIRCPPIVSDGIIYFGADDNSIYAVRADSGDSAWQQFTARDDFGMGIAVGSGMVIGACMDGILYGVTASSGKLRWPPQRLSVAPSDTSPVFSDNAAIMAVGSVMKGYTARSGQERWMVSLEAEVAATPAVSGSDIYVPCKDKKIYAFTVTGRQIAKKWTAPADLGVLPLSSPTVAGDTLFVTGSKGVVAAFSCADGTCKWRYVIAPSPITTLGADYCDAASSPIVANGALLVLTDDGVLHCFTSDTPDCAAPDIFSMKPASGSAISGAPPISMSAVLYDIGCGVDFSSVTLSLDGMSQNATIDAGKSSVTFATEVAAAGKAAKTLPDGVHTITVTAKDYSGNMLTKEWYFITDSSLPPPRQVGATETVKKTTKEPTRRTWGGRQRPALNGPGGSPSMPPLPPMPGGAPMPGQGGTAPTAPSAQEHVQHNAPVTAPDVPQY